MEINSALDALEHLLPDLCSGVSVILPRSENVVPDTGFKGVYPYESSERHYFQWSMLLSGQAHVKLDGQFYVMKAPDICFIPPLIKHTPVFSDLTPAHQLLSFTSRPDHCCCGLIRYQPEARRETLSYSFLPMPSGLPEVLIKIQEELQGTQLYADVIIRGLVVQMAGYMLRAMQEPLAIDHPLVGSISRRVLAFLEDYYARDISLRDVARVVHLTPNYLSTVFRRETGHTVVEALMEIRLRHAKRLLLEGQMPLRAVAGAVGYHNFSYFSRLFRHHAGVTPGRYGKS